MIAPLEAAGVWKSYPSWYPGTRTLRSITARRSRFAARGPSRWVLRDVSFTVAAGGSVGLIGHNGAGKSTLLRLASGLGRPTRGRVRAVPNRVSVLSLGAWFDPVLSGSENAETAAVVLGYSRREARALVDQVLEFAGLEEFAAAPVRVYSDGMRLRLAFGVIAQLEPALLVIDEALSVGDISFQQKCLDRIRELRTAGSAVLLASHDLDQVVRECDHAIWLHEGQVRFAGEAGAAIAAYREAGRVETLARTPEPGPDAPDLGSRRWGSQELTVERFRMDLPAGGPLAVELELQPHGAPVSRPHVIVDVRRESDDVVCIEASSAPAGIDLGTVTEPTRLALEIHDLKLAPGGYLITVGAYPNDWEYAFDYRWAIARFDVTGPPTAGVLAPRQRWRVVPAGPG